MTAGREIWRVLALHVRLRFGLSTLTAKKSAKEQAKIIGITLLILYVLGCVLVMEIFIGYPLIRQFVNAGMGDLVLGLIVFFSMLTVLMFGLFALIGIVFNARDAEFYAALPLRPQSLFAAKLGMVYLTELGVTALLFFPLGIMYGQVSGAGALYYPLLVVIGLMIPVLPLAAATLLCMPLMRLLARVKHRDALLVVVSFILLFALVGGQIYINMLVNQHMGDMDAAGIAELMSNSQNILSLMMRGFPPALWAVKVLMGADTLLSMALLLAVTAAGLFLVLALSQRLYYRSVLAQLESPKGKRKGYSAKGVRAGGMFGAFVRKELRVLFRSPIYLMNSMSMVVVMPLVVVMMAFIPGMDGEEMDAILSQLRSLLPEIPAVYYGVLGAAAAALMTVMTMCVATSFSREGKCFWILQTSPVTPGLLVASRAFAGALVALAGTLVLLLTMIFVMKLPALPLLAGVLPGICLMLPLLMAGMLPDAMRPKLKWNSEAEAMKQNFNAIIAMFAQLSVAVGLFFGAVGLFALGLPMTAVLVIMCLGSLLLGILGFYGVSAVVRTTLRGIEG